MSSAILHSTTPEWLIWILALSATFIPIATVNAILRYHLFDIDLREKYGSR